MFQIAPRKPAVDNEIAALNPSEFLKSLRDNLPPEYVECWLAQVEKHTKPTLALTSLSECGEGPSHCAPEPRNELPPFHSITSSARSRNDSGMVSPIALAVFVLMTNSNLVEN